MSSLDILNDRIYKYLWDQREKSDSAYIDSLTEQDRLMRFKSDKKIQVALTYEELDFIYTALGQGRAGTSKEFRVLDRLRSYIKNSMTLACNTYLPEGFRLNIEEQRKSCAKRKQILDDFEKVLDK